MEKSLLLNRQLRFFLICFCLFILFLKVNSFCYIGGEAGAYLRAPEGAEAEGMGGAYTSSPTIFATLWNPAQLSFVDKRVFSFSAGLFSFGRTEAAASLDLKLPPRIGLGIGALYRGDPFLNNLYNASEEKLQNGAYTSLTVKAALSYLLTRKLSCGLSVGFYYQRMPTSYVKTSLIYSDATSIGGFSIGIQYKLLDSLQIAFLIKDINPLQVLTGSPASIAMEWQIYPSWEQDFSSGSSLAFGSPYVVTDMIMPSFVLGTSYNTLFQNRPLIWKSDAALFLVDGTFTKLNYMSVKLSTGFEWKKWNTFILRFGLGDILINRDILDDSEYYFRNFAVKICAGFGADLSVIRKGLIFNYAATTDKIWAGINQKIDLVYKF